MITGKAIGVVKSVRSSLASSDKEDISKVTALWYLKF